MFGTRPRRQTGLLRLGWQEQWNVGWESGGDVPRGPSLKAETPCHVAPLKLVVPRRLEAGNSHSRLRDGATPMVEAKWAAGGWLCRGLSLRVPTPPASSGAIPSCKSRSGMAHAVLNAAAFVVPAQAPELPEPMFHVEHWQHALPAIDLQAA